MKPTTQLIIAMFFVCAYTGLAIGMFLGYMVKDPSGTTERFKSLDGILLIGTHILLICGMIMLINISNKLEAKK